MNLKTRVGLLAGAAALTLTGVSSADTATGQNNDELAQRLAAAEAKIAAMEAAQNQTWLTEQRATEIRGLVQDVLADADTRASLLQAGMTSGYDNGFVLGSSDANWLLRTNFLMQQRFNFNWQDDGPGIDTTRYGFENTRSKFIMSGNVVNPTWYYLVDINVGSGTGQTGTLNAYLGHDYGNGWKIQMGSMKLPFTREALVDDQFQLAVERTNIDSIFGGGYVDGLMVRYAGESLQFMGTFSDGFGTGQTPWQTLDTEFAITARGEYKFSGTWDQFKDFSNTKADESGVLLGAAIHFQNGENGTPATETDFVAFTADASLEFGGANLFGSVAFVDTETGTVDVSPFAIVLQGGFFITDNWELFGRLEWADFDVVGAEDLSIFTVGATRYFSGQNAKWTTDVGFGLEEVEVADPITAWRVDAPGQDGQIVLRTQLQILF